MWQSDKEEDAEVSHAGAGAFAAREHLESWRLQLRALSSTSAAGKKALQAPGDGQRKAGITRKVPTMSWTCCLATSHDSVTLDFPPHSIKGWPCLPAKPNEGDLFYYQEPGLGMAEGWMCHIVSWE